MPSRKSSSQKRSRAKDATIKDIKQLEGLISDVRSRPTGMKTTPKFEEINEILSEIEKDYSIKTVEGIGKFRLRQKKSHQRFEEDYTLTTIVATPEEVFREEGKIIEKIIPENLEFIITIKTHLKDGKKKIEVSINKPDTSEVDLGKDVEIICGTVTQALIPEGITPIKRPAPPRKPSTMEAKAITERRELMEELRKKTQIKKIMTDLQSDFQDLYRKYMKKEISKNELIKKGKEFVKKGNLLIPEDLKNIYNIIFDEESLQIKIEE